MFLQIAEHCYEGLVLSTPADSEFTVASKCEEFGGNDEVVHCTGRLSHEGLDSNYHYLERGKRLKFFFCFDEYNEYRNEGKKLRHSSERLAMPCAPLTSGTFYFKGCTLTDSVKLLGYEYIFEVELLSDNTLTGFCYGYGKVTGMWTQDTVQLTVSNESFLGSPNLAGLRGIWQMEVDDNDPDELESCHFEFMVERCEYRAWCESLHTFFPFEFCQSVRWLLLSSMRAAEVGKTAIPCTIWPIVLTFTDQDWFENEANTAQLKQKRDSDESAESSSLVKKQRSLS